MTSSTSNGAQLYMSRCMTAGETSSQQWNVMELVSMITLPDQPRLPVTAQYLTFGPCSIFMRIFLTSARSARVKLKSFKGGAVTWARISR
jgi:hypothetical protein